MKEAFSESGKLLIDKQKASILTQLEILSCEIHEIKRRSELFILRLAALEKEINNTDKEAR